ncbi:MAG: transcriptional regulator, partial [Candidatus Limnocylindrales bacterium]
TILERAGLLHTELQPASRGLQKVCARTYDELVFDLPRGPQHTRDSVDVEMPIGGFSDFSVEPTCGLVTATGLIGFLDDPAAFYEPARLEAQLLWFRSGYVEYRFPNRIPPGAKASSLQLTAEICSEAPLHDLDWPSDIAVWVNGVALGEWTCPSDFGGQRGRLTPSWWEEKDSQFGVLKRWLVTGDGTTIDGVRLSTVDLEALELNASRPIVVRIGVRPDADNVGGLNLFGRAFGNYPQDLNLRIEYRTGRSELGQG